MRTVSATEMQRAFGAVLHEVLHEGPVTITHHNRPQIVIVTCERYAELMAAAMVESARAKRRADTEREG